MAGGTAWQVDEDWWTTDGKPPQKDGWYWIREPENPDGVDGLTIDYVSVDDDGKIWIGADPSCLLEWEAEFYGPLGYPPSIIHGTPEEEIDARAMEDVVVTQVAPVIGSSAAGQPMPLGPQGEIALGDTQPPPPEMETRVMPRRDPLEKHLPLGAPVTVSTPLSPNPTFSERIFTRPEPEEIAYETPRAPLDAPFCPDCGTPMQRAGACHTCPDCGSSNGCG